VYLNRMRSMWSWIHTYR